MPVLSAWAGRPGTALSPQRSEQITRIYVGAFFGLHLEGTPQPLLEGPSSADPEVTFQSP